MRRNPFAGAPLCFRDLRGRHLKFGQLPIVSPGVIRRRRLGKNEPLERLDIVARNARAIAVQPAQIALRADNAQVSGNSVQPSRFGKVLGDAQTAFVHPAELVLGPRVPLARGQAIPLHRLGIVLRQGAIAVPGAEPVLSLGAAGVGSLPVAAHRFRAAQRAAGCTAIFGRTRRRGESQYREDAGNPPHVDPNFRFSGGSGAAPGCSGLESEEGSY